MECSASHFTLATCVHSVYGLGLAVLVESELLLERRIYNHLKYEDRFMMILSGKFIREILDLPQTFNVLCKTRTPEEMDGALTVVIRP